MYKAIIIYKLLCLFTSWEFFTPALADGFLLESEWQQVFSSFQDSLLSIQANLNNAVIGMVSTHLLISKSFSSCINPLVIVLSAPILLISLSSLLLFVTWNHRIVCKKKKEQRKTGFAINKTQQELTCCKTNQPTNQSSNQPTNQKNTKSTRYLKIYF